MITGYTAQRDVAVSEIGLVRAQERAVYKGKRRVKTSVGPRVEAPRVWSEVWRGTALPEELPSSPLYPFPRALLSNGPSGPESYWARVQGPTNLYFLLQHHKQNDANLNDGIGYRTNSEFST